MNKSLLPYKSLKKYLFIVLGAFLAAFSIKGFFLPNDLIDGGMVGISIMMNHLTGIPLGLYTFFFNLVFLVFGYRQIGKNFVVTSIVSISLFSTFLSIMIQVPVLTDDVLLGTVFGGVLLGIGVGLILRNSGSLDGTEVIALIVNEKSIFSVGQILMTFNVFILTAAAFIYGWESAFYSMLAYFIVQKTIDVVLAGIDEEKSALIISDESEEIASAIECRLGRMVTFMDSRVGTEKQAQTIIYTIVTRLELSKLMSIIDEKDPEAFVTISDVADVNMGKYKKRNIH